MSDDGEGGAPIDGPEVFDEPCDFLGEARSCEGRDGVSDASQGREGGLRGRESTLVSASTPRSCPTPVSASSPATLGKDERGVWAGAGPPPA